MNNWMLSSDRDRWNLGEEIAVVTGGSGGIGVEIVKGLAAKGIEVVILDRVTADGRGNTR